LPSGDRRSGRGFHAHTIDMSDLVAGMENFTDGPVIDNTGFKGLFDLDTEGWAPMLPRPGPAPGAEPTAEDKACYRQRRAAVGELTIALRIVLVSTNGMHSMPGSATNL